MASPARLRPFRTTAFKLSAIYLAVFSIFAAFLIGYIARNTSDILQAQMRRSLDAELRAMSDQYSRGGLARVARLIELRSRQPGANIYLVTDAAGQKLAGNVQSVPSAVLNQTETEPQVVPYLQVDDQDGPGDGKERHAALVSVAGLPDGARILVGRDITESEELIAVVRRSLVLTAVTMIALGLLSWVFVSRHVLRRIDSIAATSHSIVAGDLSGRLEVTGSGDEFDRLAESLNAMLERIERLMLGLKQVSDNIAHDLKTPLTRMRNRLEAALRRSDAEVDYREALQATIDDADHLIRTFNALLMIARVEAGSSDAEFRNFDAAEVGRDVFELYEPLAEEAAVALGLNAPGPAELHGNKELISQALANLVDNAIKYVDGRGGAPRVVISVKSAPGEVVFEVADNGSGVAEVDRKRIVERFVRLEESRSKPGAGLGLSLVSAVARLHGGELSLANNDPGLRAILRFPSPPPADVS